NIKIVYLKSEKLEKIIENIKNKKKNIFYKILYNLLMNYEKIEMARNVNKYISLNKDAKMFIDYSGTATKYISKINIERKIYWNHLSIEKMKPSKRVRMLKRLNNYTQIVAICEEMAQEIKTIFPELAYKVKVIYNFIDEEKIKLKVEEDKKLEEELLKEKYCISVGRLSEPKDYKTTIQAFKILKERGIKEKLFIIGDGNLKEKLNKLIKELDLEGQVFLLGMKENPYLYMKNADILIHSSRKEGFPMVLLEGMCVGVPIICSNFKTGAYELIEKERNGEIFEIANYEELANKVESLLKNNELRKNYIEKSKKFTERFYIEKIINKYKNFIEEL
ncbi:glycosyltransferase, partial [Fusobacterium perfoetens]|uniref:glycosyltransferase n=1 Tax=Fusobacterium perfoetens TaxID=852 RepID=UPI001F3EFA1E